MHVLYACVTTSLMLMPMLMRSGSAIAEAGGVSL
jgi:hypothetical protein